MGKNLRVDLMFALATKESGELVDAVIEICNEFDRGNYASPKTRRRKNEKPRVQKSKSAS